MKTCKYLLGIVLTLIVTATFACGQADQFASPLTVSVSDLEGVWEARYVFGNDMLTIKSDGTFRQVYENSRENYVFDSGWNQWTLEKLPNEIVRLHLQGGRYYPAGISLAEMDGKIPCIENDCTLEGLPHGFYDPFAEEIVYMINELLLVVKLDPMNNLILHHVWTSSDEGFALIGGDKEIFYRETDTAQ
jgi:hypothetical protein